MQRFESALGTSSTEPESDVAPIFASVANRVGDR